MGTASGNLNLSAKGFVDGINTAITALEKLKTKAGDATKDVKEFGDEANNTKSKTDSLGNTTKDAGEKVKKYDENIKDTKKNTKDFGDESEKTKTKIKTLGDSFKTVGDKLQTAGDKISKAGGTLTKYATTTATALGVYSVKKFADFESAMSGVQATSGATTEDMKKLTDKAKQMGETTKFSAKESADAMNYMAMAGWKTEDMLSGIEGIMNLAAASGEDLATTSDIVTDALTAFGLSAKDSGEFADVLAAASSNANTNVSMLGESFKYVAPVAGSLGYTAKDVAINLGLMANSGIKGGQAGTALRAALSRLVKPTDDVKAKMKELGISVTDQNGKVKSLRELNKDLRTSFSKLSDAEQAEAATILFGQEAMSGMLSIIRASDDDYDKLTKAIDGSEGSAKKMSEIRMDNFSGQLTLLKSKAEGVGIQFGQVMVPYIGKFIDKLSGALDWLSKLDDGTKDFIVTSVALIAALGPVLKIVGNITKAVGGMSKAFGLMVAHPVVAAVAGIAAVVGALTIAMNNNLEVVPKEYNAYKEFSDELKTAAQEIKNLKEAREKSVEETDAEIDYYKKLKDELDTIVDKNGKVKKGYEDRAKYITNELSQALGIEIDNNGKIIKNYENISKQIDKTIEKKRQEMYLEAYRESYIKAIKEQKKAEENLYTTLKHRQEQQKLYNDAEKKLLDLQEKLKTAQKEAAEAPSWASKEKLDEIRMLNAEIENAENDLGMYRDQLSKANGDWRTAQSVYSEYATTIHNYEEANEALISGNEERIKAALSNLVNDFKTAETGTKTQLEIQQKNYKDHYDWLIKEVQSGNSTITSDVITNAKKMVDKADAELERFKQLAQNGGINGMTYFADGISSQDSKTALTNAFTALSPLFGTNFSAFADQAADSFTEELKKKLLSGAQIALTALFPLLKNNSAVSSGLFSNLADATVSTNINGYLPSENQSTISGYSGSTINGQTSSQVNTFNFYSPKAIDEIEAASQFKKVQQQIAEGFV